MKQEYQLLYLDMLQDIQRCMKLELPEIEKAESCFWISSNYWAKLKELINGIGFKDEGEEIEFFRNVKPLFTSYIEYFVILSESLLFVPAERDCVIAFWEEEGRRFKRFCRKNESFVAYYESGKKNYDDKYFLRKSNDQSLKLVVHEYDVDSNYSTSHDPLIRSYLAHKMYWEYVSERLKSLVLGLIGN